MDEKITTPKTKRGWLPLFALTAVAVLVTWNYDSHPTAFLEPDLRPSCASTFSVAITGAWSSATTANKDRCATEYAKWLAATPPSQYAVIGRSLQTKDTVYSLNGMVIRRDVNYLHDITDAPQPSVYVSQGKHSQLLQFRTNAQADAAFKAISEAIADHYTGDEK